MSNFPYALRYTRQKKLGEMFTSLSYHLSVEAKTVSRKSFLRRNVSRWDVHTKKNPYGKCSAAKSSYAGLSLRWNVLTAKRLRVKGSTVKNSMTKFHSSHESYITTSQIKRGKDQSFFRERSQDVTLLFRP